MVKMGVYGALLVFFACAGRPALVGAAPARTRCGVRGLRDPAGLGHHRPQAAARLLDDGERRPDVPRARDGVAAPIVGVIGPADSAVAACLLLVASHAAFKSTLFLAAGSVLHGTGERRPGPDGRAGSRMPVTTAGVRGRVPSARQRCQ